MSLLFAASLVTLGGAMLLRWYYGLRVLATSGTRTCTSDLGRWLPPPGDTSLVHRAEGTAAEYGDELRKKALASWREQEPKAAAARENARRFGMAVPPLSAMIAVFAVVVRKIPLMVVLVLTIVAAIFGLLTLPAELRAIAAEAARMRKDRCFPKRDDEEAVIECAVAHAWEQALPPILRYLQK
jgi:hypothetical protein